MAELTDFDRAEMRAAALDARRGRWFRIWNSRSPDSIRICCEGSERSPVATVRCPELSEASSLDAEIQPAYDAAHIAASYPDRVLALLDERFEIEQQLPPSCKGLAAAAKELADRCAAAVQQRDEARAEVERLRARIKVLERVREAAERAAEVWSAPVWVEFRAALDAAKEATDG